MRASRLPKAWTMLIAGIVMTLAASFAEAQFRNLPANAKRATLSGYQNPFVILGGDQLRLAPGAVIFDTNNRTIVPMSLPAEADVVYTTDLTGSVLRIYLLTPQEQQKLDQSRR